MYNRFDKLPLPRLFHAFIVVTALVLIGWSMWTAHSLSQAKGINSGIVLQSKVYGEKVQELTRHYYPLSLHLSSLKHVTELYQVEFELIIVDGERGQAPFEEILQELAISPKRLRSDWPIGVEKELLEQLLIQIEILSDIGSEVLETDSPNQLLDLYDDSVDVLQSVMQELDLLVNAISKEYHFAVNRTAAASSMIEVSVGMLKERLDFISLKSVLISIVIIAVLLFSQLAIFSVIRGRIGRLKEYAQQIEGGDYDVLLPLNSNDDLSDLFIAINSMSQTLVALLEKTERLAKSSEAASKVKSEFISTMSHEIRTPMNAIVGFTHILEQGDLTLGQEELIKKIKVSSNCLQQLLNDILDFSKIESKTLYFERSPVKISDELANIVTVLHGENIRSEVEIYVRINPRMPERIYGDPRRLNQVMTNLIGNAIKFTDEGFVKIEVDWVPVEESLKGLLIFSVTDTGEGIEQGHLDTIFNSFSQEDGSSTRQQGGIGLGLSICKNIVELMGGELRVKSEFGEGSTFSFGVESEAVSGQSIVENLDPLQEIRMLVVESNTQTVAELRDMLEPYVASVVLFSSMVDALGSICEGLDGQYDVVLLEIEQELPESVALIETLQKSGRAKHIGLISDAATPYGKTEFSNLGVHKCIDRPIIQIRLLDALIEMITDKRALSDESKSTKQEKQRVSYDDVRCLVVDDVEFNRILMKKVLAKYGISVETAEDGQDALKKLDARYSRSPNSGFNLVFMDIMMPIMDGYQAMQAIRKSEVYGSVTVIALTACATQEERQRCFDCGADAYLMKPLNIKELESTMAKVIGSGASSTSPSEVDKK